MGRRDPGSSALGCTRRYGSSRSQPAVCPLPGATGSRAPRRFWRWRMSCSVRRNQRDHMSATAPASHPLLAPDLDPALPGLAAQIDPAAVADMFRLWWPGGDSGPVIRQCTLEHALWRPGVDCVATYRLDVLGSNGEASTMGAVAISPGSVLHWLYNIAPALPGLASAADPRAVNAWLAAHAGGDPQHYTLTPVRYS